MATGPAGRPTPETIQGKPAWVCPGSLGGRVMRQYRGREVEDLVEGAVGVRGRTTFAADPMLDAQ